MLVKDTHLALHLYHQPQLPHREAGPRCFPWHSFLPSFLPSPHLRVLLSHTDVHSCGQHFACSDSFEVNVNCVAVLFRSRVAADFLQLLDEAVYVCVGKECAVGAEKTVVHVKWARSELGCGKPTYLLGLCGSATVWSSSLTLRDLSSEN
jgi:hypothetical protein